MYMNIYMNMNIPPFLRRMKKSNLEMQTFITFVVSVTEQCFQYILGYLLVTVLIHAPADITFVITHMVNELF